jgi:hypothetical protein
MRGCRTLCLTRPRSRSCSSANVETGSELGEDGTWKPFGEYISELRHCGNVQNLGVT